MAPRPATAAEIHDVNARYHDVAAGEYDRKWAIDFGAAGRRQVLGKLRKALGADGRGPFAGGLEVGAGTGYFGLNLLQARMIESLTATDISPGMLGALAGNAARLGLDVATVATGAEALPFDDASFDLVFGHAVLHHLPRLERVFAELARVLSPGGTIVFAGEPSRHGDRLAAVPKRGAQAVAPLWRGLMGADAARNGHAAAGREQPDDHRLERFVDVHAFVPEELAGQACAAGLQGVQVRGEELLANWFGWANRTLEASAEPSSIPPAWTQYAYRGYLVLQEVDRRLLEPRLPAAIFYNLMLTARKPA